MVKWAATSSTRRKEKGKRREKTNSTVSNSSFRSRAAPVSDKGRYSLLKAQLVTAREPLLIPFPPLPLLTSTARDTPLRSTHGATVAVR
jgi:hypothetical protein